jgi:putative methionine-R-sulfoxide reductase with GAF domain
MPPRTLASLAQALSIAPDLNAALVALGEVLAEIDRSASVALLRYDQRKQMLRERLTPSGSRVETAQLETTFDHLPGALQSGVSTGGQFVDFGDKSEDFARLFGMRSIPDGGLLSLRGLRTDGALAAVVALYEPKKFFGTRTSERFAPSVALFDLAFMRFAELNARTDAVRTLEEVTQRVHGDYVRKLTTLESQLTEVKGHKGKLDPAETARVLELERELADSREESRRRAQHLDAVEQQIGAAVSKLEQAHLELHRRSDLLRQKTRTLYLVERMLQVHASASEPRQLVDAILNLAGDDMQATRCSLMLVTPDGDSLYLAASRGLAADVAEGSRVKIGEGISGRVAQSREPLLVRDVEEAQGHPMLRDQFLRTGSFISFPIQLHNRLLGVVNLMSRERQGVFTDEDIERVSFLGLVISMIVDQARLTEKLLEPTNVS